MRHPCWNPFDSTPCAPQGGRNPCSPPDGPWLPTTMQLSTTPSTKAMLVALRLCAAAATGVLLWSYPPEPGMARVAGVFLWAVYAGTALVLPLVPGQWFERPRLLPIF